MTDGQVEIEISRDAGVQTIRIQRPEKKNALLPAMYQAMYEALVDGDESSDVRAHILIGSGGVFSAGNDIKDFMSRAKDGVPQVGETPVHRFIGYLPRVEKPLIAAVDGLAVGVGVTLLFHCDLVYASPSAKLITPFLDLGLVPEAGSSLLAPRRMGHTRAFEMLALGEAFSGERAREAGLVNAVVAADELEATARAAALRLAAKPPAALKIARDLMRGASVDEIVERLEAESKLFAGRMASPEAKEAFQAFVEKRPPNFNAL
ncbi:MAG: enoyl-CoA hydratase/carnithine racemase [Hyphomicrobiaceae bacterium]|jgi:enoyl-CoA hydratase/carnithine racemase